MQTYRELLENTTDLASEFKQDIEDIYKITDEIKVKNKNKLLIYSNESLDNLVTNWSENGKYRKYLSPQIKLKITNKGTKGNKSWIELEIKSK